MTKDEALQMCLEYIETNAHERRHVRWAIKEALAQPEQEPVAWKLVPRYATEEMLKAMDECSTEGYDERLYAGHAASVYMAAVDVAPTPPQRKPLTDEEIKAIENGIWKPEFFDDTERQANREFAQAIEAAHGIKGEA